MVNPHGIQEFTPQPDDPLGPEHVAIQRWVQAAVQSSHPDRYWEDVDLKSVEEGRVLLDAAPEQAKRYALAALARARHWDEEIASLRASANTELDRINLHRLPGWEQIGPPRRHVVVALTALIRRSLPFAREDILALLTWSTGLGVANSYQAPLAYVTKSLQRYAAANQIDPELRQVMRSFAALVRTSYQKEVSRLGTVVEQLCEESPADVVPPEQHAVTRRASPEPSSAGNSLVLHRLKWLLGLTPDGTEPTTSEVGPDGFRMPIASPLVHEHERITNLLNSAPNPREISVELAILDLDPTARGRLVLAAAERHIAALLAPPNYTDTRHWESLYAVMGIARSMVSSRVQFDRDALFDFLLYLSMHTQENNTAVAGDFDRDLLAGVKNVVASGNLTEGERYVLHLWRASRFAGPPLGLTSPDIEQLTEWIGDGFRFFLVPGDCWSDAVNADLATIPPAKRSGWIALLKHALTATSSRPSERWRKAAMTHIEVIGEGDIRHFFERWLPLVDKGQTLVRMPAFLGDARAAADSIHDENAMALRGLLWFVPLLDDRKKLVRLVSAVALSAYKKVPGVGPRTVKVGNAAVYALSEMVSPEAIGQLAMLKVRVRFGTAQKEIEKAFDAAAAALDLPRDQIEEMSVPACGLETVGRRDEIIGEYRAELIVTSSEADLRWFDPWGKQMKSVPASVKKDDAETLKELQQGLKDIGAMLSAQRERIDALFLERKSWPASVWRERYLDHPLVGTIARRLIWCIGETSVTVADGQPLDLRGNPFEISDNAVVTLWHPASRSISDVVAWRSRIEALGIVQPFKQAHREIYLLTDAELRTDTYSNRFAAHILRQHQFNALCGARRWKNKLRLMVDDTYPPASRDLPAWGLRAEFWIEGIGTEYGSDTNDAGVFLRLTSDQVRFYRMGAATNRAHAGGGGYAASAFGPGLENINEPIKLNDVPALVFSEIMRDVDLFVGVASIGNDPTWQEGGPGGRYRDYWESYSFGDLSATAVTRREALQRLVPRLKIADRCTLGDKFLIVRGDKRTYKIHFGSGNILMEPNDQYLCIVPDSRGRSGESPMYLPFEGDATLSIILSKAFLLVEDSKIKDPTINRQIDGR